MEQYIVVTALKTGTWSETKDGKDPIRNYIEELVQRRSRIESYANSVFSMMLLNRFESKCEITAPFVSQAAISACIRSVCIRGTDIYPKEVEYTKYAEVQQCIRVAARIVTQRMNTFDSDEGLGQIMNDSARRYLTVFTNNFAENMDKWQYRTIRADLQYQNHAAVGNKTLLEFIVRSISRIITCSELLDRSKYKDMSIQKYIIADDMICQSIIERHSRHLIAAKELKRTADEAKLKKGYNAGIMPSCTIQHHVHFFVSYGIWLQRITQELDSMYKSEPKSERKQQKNPKAPYQVIAQLTMKVRFLKFGTEQMVEMMPELLKSKLVRDLFKSVQIPSTQDRTMVNIQKKTLKVQKIQKSFDDQDDMVKKATTLKQLTNGKKSLEKLHIKLVKDKAKVGAKRARTPTKDRRIRKKHKVEKTELETYPKEIWVQMIKDVRSRLFAIPLHLYKRWTGSVSTDGIVAHWHLEKQITPQNEDDKMGKTHKKVGPIPVNQLQKRHYGVHQQDSEFSALNDLNVIAVDPGQVNLISAIRLHRTEDALQRLAVDSMGDAHETKKQRRRRLLREKMFELKRSTFTLSNKEWQSNTGQLLHIRRIKKLQDATNMNETYCRLAESSSRTCFSQEYLLHIQARIETAPNMQKWMRIKMPRRWKFEAYQKEQRAVTKLVSSLLGGFKPSNTIVVWGNGGFGPTSHGHASAPNKKMQLALSKHIPLVLGSEYRSSVTSACHHGLVKKIFGKNKCRRRYAIVKCKKCCRMLSRDANAAHVIADMFIDMLSSCKLPEWIADDQTRERNS